MKISVINRQSCIRFQNKYSLCLAVTKNTGHIAFKNNFFCSYGCYKGSNNDRKNL